ncbi:hypothetical protein Aduo_011470 [Ancylostoma duodenale]
MHTVLGPLLGEEVFCYLDDIIIASDTAERHLEMLEKVFNALQGAEFSGHVIGREDPAKVEAIIEYPLPQTRSELRTFLGMCSYYRKIKKMTDLEALAVVFALRKFHMFVHRLPVEVYTDHQALTALFKLTNVSARVLRWALEMQKYNLEMIYLKGAANRVADALSRGATSPQDSTREEPIPNELIDASTTEGSYWTRELREHPTYGQIISDLEEGNCPA